jgi:hypothetical protein
MRSEDMEKCVYCETIYELKESNSHKPKAFCSRQCAYNYDEAIRKLEFKKQPNPNCVVCFGEGTVDMDDTIEGYSFDRFTCECVKV